MKMYSEFSRKPIDAAYVLALTELVNACSKYDVELDTVSLLLNGFHVTFKDFPNADAICHDGSYGSPNYGAMRNNSYTNEWYIEDILWETIGFPWDGDDVSVHTGEELAKMIRALKDGRDWSVYEN